MTSTCPVCNKSVDPLRSRFVRVVGGKVVAYCSVACAGTGESAAPVAAAIPTGTVSPATGVPVRILTPPSGVQARAPGEPVRTRATPPAGVPARTATPAAGTPVNASTRASGGTPAGASAGTPAGASGGTDGPPRPVTPPQGAVINLDSGPVIEIVHEPTSGVMTSARDERTEPRAKHPDEIPIAAFWSADKAAAAARGAEPGSAPIAVPGAASGAARAATGDAPAKRDDTLDRWAIDATDHSGTRAASDADLSPPRSRLGVIALVVLLLAAGGWLAYQYLLKNNLAAATRIEPPAAAVVAPPPEPAPPAAPAPVDPVVDPAVALDKARATLRASLTATSPRLQRVAAAALARTEDTAARDVLVASIGVPDLSDIARLDLAYALARGGDKRGNDVLAGALHSTRADLRDESARLLALLGDRRAVPHLVDVLDVSQRRLGAAEHLAHLAEPHAIKVLEQIRGDARSLADDKARATIALGHAGRAAVAPALHDMLADPHFNAFAAAALAELSDRAARPVLEHLLDSPSLRVRAARALRRLEPALDPRPLLPRLLDVLARGRDRDQVQAAEAILLLAGPPAWSAFE